MLAEIKEIFSSIQGEGEFVGYFQLFLRFYHCNLKCNYCDTENEKVKPCSIELSPLGTIIEQENPLSSAVLLTLLAEFAPSAYHSLSLTGGEPLLSADYLGEILPPLKEKGWLVYLETNGTLPDSLQKILPFLDFISMDIKLPSAIKTDSCWEAHRQFLTLSSLRKVFVKIVVTAETNSQELENAARLIACTSREIPLILQPVTPCKNIKIPSPNQLFKFYQTARKILDKVRIIPQTHTILGVK